MKLRSTGRRAAVVFCGNLLPPLAAFFTSPLIAQSLGVEGRGIVTAATAPLTLMLGVATLGLPEAVTYFVARHPHRLQRTTSTAALLIGAAGLLATLLIVLCAPALSAGNGQLARLIMLASLALAPSLVIAVIRGTAAGLAAWGLVTADRVAQSLFRLVAVLVLAAAHRMTAESATGAIALSGLVGLLAYAPLLARRAPSAEIDSDSARLLSFGMRNWAGSLTGILISRLDQSLMVPLSSAFQLGLYAVAVSISEIPLVINSAIRDVVYAAESERQDAERLARAARVSNALTLVAAVGVGLAAVYGTAPLFGAGFSGSVPVALLLLLAVVGGNTGSIVGMGLSARGRPGLRSLSLTVGLAVNVVALVMLTPGLGATGAALSTLAANCVTAICNLVWLRVFFGLEPRSFFGVRRGDFPALHRDKWLARPRPREIAAADS